MNFDAILTSARDVLARAKENTKISPRMLARLAKKVRLAEGAAKRASAPDAGGTTTVGLRAILARAEAASAARAPSADQLRALDELRARISAMDGAQPDMAKLAESLAADTEHVEAELARHAKAPRPEARAKKARPAERTKSRAKKR